MELFLIEESQVALFDQTHILKKDIFGLFICYNLKNIYLGGQKFIMLSELSCSKAISSVIV